MWNAVLRLLLCRCGRSFSPVCCSVRRPSFLSGRWFFLAVQKIWWELLQWERELGFPMYFVHNMLFAMHLFSREALREGLEFFH